MNEVVKLYYFGNSQYDIDGLGVYIVCCHSKDSNKSPVVVPILAPLNEDIMNVSNRTSSDAEAGYSFSTAVYIKTCAKKAIMELADNVENRWTPEDYSFSIIRFRLGPLSDCISHGKGEDVRMFMNSDLFTFNDMLAYFVMDQGTIPVTEDAIKATANEKEGVIEGEAEMTHNLPCPDDDKLH